MIIHFTTARESVVSNMSTMRKIISLIYETGHVLSRDWMGPFYMMYQKGVDDLSPTDIYKLHMDAIERADLIVVEGSRSSFGTGLQVATALLKKKPTLLLIDKENVDKESSMSRGMNDPLLLRKEYTLTTLPNIVKDFIEENTVNIKDLRFNFVIDRQIYNHLRRQSFLHNKTKAEVLRDLLLKDIDGKA